jgi:hypothetical protein
MTYNEIMKISNIEEKELELKNFYINEINVNDWLLEKTKNQKIKFKDRYEYKMNGEYHCITGPAIDFDNEEKNIYYIYGKTYIKNDWMPIATKMLREKKIKRTLNII